MNNTKDNHKRPDTDKAYLHPEIHRLEPVEFTWARFEIAGYWLECEFTIFGSTRVKVRRPDAMGYQCNWCCGQTPLVIVIGVNAAIGYILKGKVNDMPFASAIKPMNNDVEFFETILPYYGNYITNILGDDPRHREFVENMTFPLFGKLKP